MKRTVGSFILLLAALSPGCKSPTPIPPPAPGSWLVFLCKASDAPQEPHNIDFYKELFDKNQRDLLFDYFQTISSKVVDVSGTEVYGWFTMGTSVTTAVLDPMVRNNGTNPNRSQTLQDCKAAGVASLLALGQSINTDNYTGIIAVINVPVDAGATGINVVSNEYESASFYAHEMLHALGIPILGTHLPHSNLMTHDLTPDHSWDSGGDSEYNDCWDIMSYLSCIHSFNTPTHGRQGPELQIAYKQKMGWVPSSRIFTRSYSDPTPSTVTLVPVSEPGTSGFLMANIEMTGIGSYVVEYRVRSGFDRAVPRAGVLIRELRRNGRTYLIRRPPGDTTDWQQGERFTDTGNFLSITIDSITPQAATITIDPRFVSGATAGQVCGNKYVGVVRSCPAGTTCDARRTGTLVSVDYFCL
jgi:hypothetical protein